MHTNTSSNTHTNLYIYIYIYSYINHFGLTNNDISTLFQLTLKDNYFEFFGQCYAQGDCLAMGNRLSIVAANCFVYTLELKLFQLLGRTPKLWIRFIDDIFIMDTFDNLHLDIILNNLNNLHPNIHVTSTLVKNTETNNFLDISIQINQGHLQTGFYRKPTHCGSVLDFYSHHADSFKYSVAVGQFKRVKTLSNTTETQELSFNIIRETLRSSH